MGGGNRADPPAPPGHWVVALEALLMATAEPSHSDNDSDDDDEPDYVNVPLNSPHVRKLESTLQLLDDLIDAARKSRAESGEYSLGTWLGTGEATVDVSLEGIVNICSDIH